MTDHDPLTEAIVTAEVVLEGWNDVREWAPPIRAALDAAGYEVRPKLTAEKLAAALPVALVMVNKRCPADLRQHMAAAILAALDAAP